MFLSVVFNLVEMRLEYRITNQICIIRKILPHMPFLPLLQSSGKQRIIDHVHKTPSVSAAGFTYGFRTAESPSRFWFFI